MSAPLTLAGVEQLDFAKGAGLVPAVVQDAADGTARDHREPGHERYELRRSKTGLQSAVGKEKRHRGIVAYKGRYRGDK